MVSTCVSAPSASLPRDNSATHLVKPTDDAQRILDPRPDFAQSPQSATPDRLVKFAELEAAEVVDGESSLAAYGDEAREVIEQRRQVGQLELVEDVLQLAEQGRLGLCGARQRPIGPYQTRAPC
jgi:hypothetical protein